MKTKFAAAALLLAVTAVPAIAGDEASASAGNHDVCLYRRDVDGWGAHGDHAMIINDRFNRKFLLTLAGYCTDLNFSFAAGIRPFGGFGGPCVERGDHIVMRGGGAMRGPSACWITKVERYTPEMEKADRAAREAKEHSGL